MSLLLMIGGFRYKLVQPTSAYEPFYQETKSNFEVCDGIVQVLEGEDNDNLTFGQTIRQVTQFYS